MEFLKAMKVRLKELQSGTPPKGKWSTVGNVERKALSVALKAGLLTVGKEVGSGGQGHVFIATHSGKQYALKQSSFAEGSRQERIAQADLEFGTSLHHECLQEYLAWTIQEAGVSSKGKKLLMLKTVQLLAETDLHDALDKGTFHTAEGLPKLGKLLMVFHEVARGVAYLHGQRVVHCDLKHSNVLLTGCEGTTPSARVCDFGLCVRIQSTDQDWCLGKHGRGTHGYIAPEIYPGVVMKDGRCMSLITLRSDVYSMGIMLWEALTLCAAASHSKSVSKESPRLPCNVHPNFPRLACFPPLEQFVVSQHGSQILQALEKLIEDMCHSDWQQRPDSSTVVASLAHLITQLETQGLVGANRGHLSGSHTSHSPHGGLPKRGMLGGKHKHKALGNHKLQQDGKWGKHDEAGEGDKGSHNSSNKNKGGAINPPESQTKGSSPPTKDGKHVMPTSVSSNTSPAIHAVHAHSPAALHQVPAIYSTPPLPTKGSVPRQPDLDSLTRGGLIHTPRTEESSPNTTTPSDHSNIRDASPVHRGVPTRVSPTSHSYGQDPPGPMPIALANGHGSTRANTYGAIANAHGPARPAGRVPYPINAQGPIVDNDSTTTATTTTTTTWPDPLADSPAPTLSGGVTVTDYRSAGGIASGTGSTSVGGPSSRMSLMQAVQDQLDEAISSLATTFRRSAPPQGVVSPPPNAALSPSLHLRVATLEYPPHGAPHVHACQNATSRMPQTGTTLCGTANCGATSNGGATVAYSHSSTPFHPNVPSQQSSQHHQSGNHNLALHQPVASQNSCPLAESHTNGPSEPVRKDKATSPCEQHQGRGRPGGILARWHQMMEERGIITPPPVATPPSTSLVDTPMSQLFSINIGEMQPGELETNSSEITPHLESTQDNTQSQASSGSQSEPTALSTTQLPASRDNSVNNDEAATTTHDAGMAATTQPLKTNDMFSCRILDALNNIGKPPMHPPANPANLRTAEAVAAAATITGADLLRCSAESLGAMNAVSRRLAEREESAHYHSEVPTENQQSRAPIGLLSRAQSGLSIRRSSSTFELQPGAAYAPHRLLSTGTSQMTLERVASDPPRWDSPAPTPKAGGMSTCSSMFDLDGVVGFNFDHMGGPTVLESHMSDTQFTMRSSVLYSLREARSEPSIPSPRQTRPADHPLSPISASVGNTQFTLTTHMTSTDLPCPPLPEEDSPSSEGSMHSDFEISCGSISDIRPALFYHLPHSPATQATTACTAAALAAAAAAAQPRSSQRYQNELPTFDQSQEGLEGLDVAPKELDACQEILAMRKEELGLTREGLNTFRGGLGMSTERLTASRGLPLSSSGLTTSREASTALTAHGLTMSRDGFATIRDSLSISRDGLVALGMPKAVTDASVDASFKVSKIREGDKSSMAVYKPTVARLGRDSVSSITGSITSPPTKLLSPFQGPSNLSDGAILPVGQQGGVGQMPAGVPLPSLPSLSS